MTTETTIKRKRPTTAERLAKLEEKAKQLKARMQAKENRQRAKERKVERKERNAVLMDLGVWVLGIFERTKDNKEAFDKNISRLEPETLTGKRRERRERTAAWLIKTYRPNDIAEFIPPANATPPATH